MTLNFLVLNGVLSSRLSCLHHLHIQLKC